MGYRFVFSISSLVWALIGFLALFALSWFASTLVTSPQCRSADFVPAAILKRSVWKEGSGFLQALPDGSLARFDIDQWRVQRLRVPDGLQETELELLAGPDHADDTGIADFAMDDAGRTLVLVKDLQTVLVFSRDGRWSKQFRLPFKTFIGLLPCGGEGVWVNSSGANRALLIEFDYAGRERRSIGQPIHLGSDDDLRDLVGSTGVPGSWSVVLGTCLGDNRLAVAFKYLPLLQVYSLQGGLEWELRLDKLPPVRNALRRFKADGSSCDGVRYSSYGHPVPLLADWLIAGDDSLWLFLRSQILLRIGLDQSVEIIDFPEESRCILRQAAAVDDSIFMPQDRSIIRFVISIVDPAIANKDQSRTHSSRLLRGTEE